MTHVVPFTALFISLLLPSPTSHAQGVIVPGAASPPETNTTEPSPDAPRSATVGARIVRLSQVKGAVQLDRDTSTGFETAFANLPITEGQKLQTAQGVAEIEFEDNSTVRLTPDSFVEFPDLKRASTGETTSRVLVRRGTVYVSLAKAKAEDFKLSVGRRTIVLPPGSHVRLDVNGITSTLTVFSGDVRLEDATADVVVRKKKAVTFDTTSPGTAMTASNTEEGAFDQWDKQSADYHNLRSVPAAFSGSGYAYGANDLSYYGSFVNAGGCGGAMWRPYLASAAWNPYGSGVWAWYPSAGYSWVSPYPWGWTPFHSGSWSYCQGAGGWGWRPGGDWRGLQNSPTNLAPGQGPVRLPGNGPISILPKPPTPPASGRPTLSVVNTQPPSISRMISADRFEFRNDSAGLGIPRGAISRLSNVSKEAAQHGMVSKTIDAASFSSPGSERGGPLVHGNAVPQNGAGMQRANGSSQHTEHSRAMGPAGGSNGPRGPAPSGGAGGGAVGGGGHAAGGSAPAAAGGHR